MHDYVYAQLLGNCKLDQLLEKPASHRYATGLNPDVRAEADPQRVDTTNPHRKHFLLRQDRRSRVFEGTEQLEVPAVDDDPVLDRGRARLQTSAEQRTAIPIDAIAGRNECGRRGHVGAASVSVNIVTAISP